VIEPASAREPSVNRGCLAKQIRHELTGLATQIVHYFFLAVKVITGPTGTSWTPRIPFLPSSKPEAKQ
jgi:hypothetical protein